MLVENEGKAYRRENVREYKITKFKEAKFKSTQLLNKYMYSAALFDV